MRRRELFRAEKLPVLQNRMFPTAAAALATATGDVRLVQDEDSGLVFNQAFDPAALVYDREYQNEQACSPVFKRHLDEATALIERHFGGQSLLDVGCGKGYFLEHLHAAGFEIRGIDPAYEGDNPRIVQAPFERGLGLSAEAIVLRHVLEHIPDPLSFLAQIAAANGGRGGIYIEVPCFDWICEHRAWFDIFYEHVNYFRLQDFARMFGRVYQSGHVFGGQYLYVLADLASLRTPVADPDDRARVPDDFLAGVERAISRVLSSPRRRHAVWGGASKGVIFSLYLKRAGVTLDEVIDINPAKQGGYLAGTGLRVSAPEEAFSRLAPGDDVFVMNSNYKEEIISQSGNRYSYHTVDQ